MSSFISLSVEPSNLTAAGSGMRTPLMPPARPRAQLRHEASWRGMPQERADDPAPHGAHAIVLARWTTSAEGEGNAIGPQGYYVIALALRPTLMRLSSHGHVLHDGPIDRGMVQVTAPATQIEYRAHAPSDFLHIY